VHAGRVDAEDHRFAPAGADGLGGGGVGRQVYVTALAGRSPLARIAATKRATVPW
jgi:hypothetical protein